MALASIAIADVPMLARLLAGAALSLSVFYQVWRLSAAVPSGLTLFPEGTVEMSFRDGRVRSGSVDPRSTQLSWLVVLHVQSAESHHVLPLVRDALSKDDFRVLCLWLRWMLPIAQPQG